MSGANTQYLGQVLANQWRERELARHRSLVRAQACHKLAAIWREELASTACCDLERELCLSEADEAEAYAQQMMSKP